MKSTQEERADEDARAPRQRPCPAGWRSNRYAACSEKARQNLTYYSLSPFFAPEREPRPAKHSLNSDCRPRAAQEEVCYIVTATYSGRIQ